MFADIVIDAYVYWLSNSSKNYSIDDDIYFTSKYDDMGCRTNKVSGNVDCQAFAFSDI